MSKKQPKKKSKKTEPTPPQIIRPVVHKERNLNERNIKNYARKFYEIMRSIGQGTFVNGITLYKKFDEIGWSVGNNPTFLWRIWRQCEADFPDSVDFLAQSSVHWHNRPSGWRYVGSPQFDRPRKKKLK